MHKSNSREGFTIVELSLSIVFVALLSIAVVIIANNLIASYQRSLTLKQINTVGSELIDDMRSAISNSSAKKSLTSLCSIYEGDEKKSCEDDNAYHLVSVIRRAKVTDKINNRTIGDDTSLPPVIGAFCSGAYSYIWNSGYFYDNGDGRDRYSIEGIEQPATFKYRIKEGTELKEKEFSNFRLLKINDPERTVCKWATAGNSKETQKAKYIENNDFSNFDISSYRVLTEEPIDLILNSNNSNLAIYDFDMSRPAQEDSTKNIFYAGSFILATVKGGINIMANGDYCTTPSDSTAINDFNYCAINKFNFAMQAMGE